MIHPLLILVALSGCVPLDLDDDPDAYISSLRYRRGILERDLEYGDNTYGERRWENYGVRRSDWERLPERDLATLPLTPAAYAAAVQGNLEFDEATASSLVPDRVPATDAQWLALGERVFFEYPLRADPMWTAVVGIPGALEQVGAIQHPDGSFVGLRVLQVGSEVAIGQTCASCHAGDGLGEVSGSLSNRWLDVGQVSLLAGTVEPLLELDTTSREHLADLGPGRNDVLGDGEFNPYAFADFGGIADIPRLQHNGNWQNRSIATLAVRCETLFLTSSGQRTRIPRVLSWALARYLRSLPPPPPVDEPSESSSRGESIFEGRCARCHTPPLYTSDRVVPLDEIGTDPSAALSPSRTSPGYRIPSLRGVGWTAPYLHHGVFADLEEMFDPEREEPGHEFGLDLDEAERADLLAFLRTL